MLHESSDGSWGGIEDADFVLFNDFPPSAPVWGVRGTFIYDLANAIGQRSVDNIRMPRNPANVRGAPVDICFWMDIEYRFMGEPGLG